MLDVPTRLRRAILNNDLLLVQRIVSAHRQDIQNPDYNNKGNTSLHYAAKLGFFTIAAFLVDAGHENEGVSRNYDGQTALHLAASSIAKDKSEEMVHFLASRWPNSVEWRDKTGKTALMLASTAGNDPVVNILSDFNSPLNAPDLLGNTALHYASAYGHLKTIRSLIERGAAVDILNRKGWTARSYSYSLQAEQYFITLTEKMHVDVNNNNSSSNSMNNITHVNSNQSANSVNSVNSVNSSNTSAVSSNNNSNDYTANNMTSGGSNSNANINNANTINGTSPNINTLGPPPGAFTGTISEGGGAGVSRRRIIGPNPLERERAATPVLGRTAGGGGSSAAAAGVGYEVGTGIGARPRASSGT